MADQPAPVSSSADTQLPEVPRDEITLPTAVARRIGRFTLLDELGRGGMGAVFAAYDEQLDRRVAIKMLRGLFVRDEDARRFEREAQAMARLSHPNVAQIYDSGHHEGHPYLAIEFVRGRTLADWQAERPRSWREVVAVYAQVGAGLAAAHAAGLLHRDFKPHNVLIGDDGRARIIDFGLARTMGEAAAETGRPALQVELDDGPTRLDTPLTADGALMGTPGYMPPEQLRGRPFDAAGDQFAFCVALYESLYGQPPFERASLVRLLTAMEADAVAPPPPSNAPPWLRALVLRGLRAKPAERFPSMDALLAELNRADRDADPGLARVPRLVLLVVYASLAIGVSVGALLYLGVEPPPVRGSLGTLEYRSVAATVLGADAALKAAAVSLVAIHLARGIGGRGYVVFTGSQDSVEAALEAGEGAVELEQRFARELIARPHPDMDWALGRLTRR
ncbi:MAG: protein kinase [Myxococcales bacterium]|nr:protein kinase [Myxococcales bacterium]